MMLAEKIKAIRPDLTGDDFLDKVKLQDDGYGPYIAEWHLPGRQPSDEEIARVNVPVKIKKPPITIESLADALIRKGLLTENEVRGNGK